MGMTNWGPGGAPHLANKISPWGPPIFQIIEMFWDRCCLLWEPNRFSASPHVPVIMHEGLRQLQILRLKFCQGYPLFDEF